MRIDGHVHAMDAGRDAEGRLVGPLRVSWRNADPKTIIAANKAIGIQRVVQVDPPELCFATAEAFGDFAVPVPQINLDRDTPATIDAFFQRGAKGIKFIAPAYAYSDDRYMKHYQAVLDNHGLAVFHTGYLANGVFGPGGVIERDTYADITLMRPAFLDRIARFFPKLKMMLAHFGNPWWEEAWKVVSANPNIYADLSGGTAYRRELEMWRWLFAPNGILDVNVVSRLCFATDGDAFISAYAEQVSLFDDFHERLYERLKLPDELIEKINHGNIETLIQG